jgi:hypothetical protein
MSGWRRLTVPLAAAAALGYLAAMAVTGAMPVQRQFVPFEARGVLKIPPERIRRVEMDRGAEHVALVRTGEKSWSTAGGADIGTDPGSRVSMAVQMMHTSAPSREMTPGELAGTDPAAFELDPPRILARLYDDVGRLVLTARFGGANADGFFQYMRLDGDGRLYLISRFVGAEWADAMDGSVRP